MSCSTPVSATTATGGSTSIYSYSSQRLINRLKNTNPEKFCSLVQMHLSFLLDLSGSSLEEFLCTDDLESEHKSVSKLFASFGRKRCHKDRDIKPCGGIFGQALTQGAIETIFPLIDFLKRPDCLAEEGLFRKSGQAVRQRHLQDALNSGNQANQVEDDLLNGVYTAHDCASVIKVFLRELPEPLLMSRHYIAYTQIPGMNNPSKQMQTLQLLIQLLPQENAFLLRVLLELLHRVATEPTNKMTADTLGTLFAPHLLVPRTINANDLQTESGNVTAVVSFMITHHSEMFEYPVTLVRDVQLYWDNMDAGCLDLNKTSGSRDGLSSDDDLDSCSCPRFRKRVDPLDRTLNTTVTFVNRQQTSDYSAADYTNKQIAELYAYVSLMPDSPQKHRFVKQFNKVSHNNGTPLPSCDAKSRRHPASLTGSLRKMMMCKTPAKRKNSYDLAQQCSVAMPDSSYTPLAKSKCYSKVDNTTTPSRGSQCAVSLRRQIQDSIQIQCSKLPLGSSHSSLSSSSSAESCDTCSIHSNASLTTTSTTTSTSSCTSSSCSEQSLCQLPPVYNNNNNIDVTGDLLQSSSSPSLTKCSLDAHRLAQSSQSLSMLTTTTTNLPHHHLCFDDLDEEENKENTTPVLNSQSGSVPVLSTSFECEPMEVSMETQSPTTIMESASSLSSSPALLRRVSTPVATPTCIRA